MKRVARVLASECMVVVQARERLEWAKGVIWGAWMERKGRMESKGLGARFDAAAVEEDIWLQV